jgi:hypothetical protein
MNTGSRCLLGLGAVLLAACGQSEAELEDRLEWIYRDTGAIQCESDGLSISEMRQQLDEAGIAVHDSACGADGKMYTTVCGAASGRIGMFEITASDLQTAAAMGFEPLNHLPEATRTPCPDDSRAAD